MEAEHPSRDFHTSLEGAFKSSKYHDLIIQCDGQEFKVHKIVVCGQSPVFSKMCDGDWLEKAQGIVKLEDDSASAVHAMLQFMYTFDFDSSGNDLERMSPMLFDVEVYSLAEKYDVSPLKLLTQDKFRKAVETCWDMDDFAQTVVAVYSSTPSTDRGLRDTIAEVTRDHIATLLEKCLFKEVLEVTAGFAADVIQLMASGSAKKKYRCPNCGSNWEAVIAPSTHYVCQNCRNGRYDWQNYAH